MADVDVGTIIDSTSAAENVSVAVSTASLNPSVNDATSVAESVTTPTFALKLYRGTNSVTVSLITMDWSLVEAYRQFRNTGVPLKGIILIPGSGAPDTFVIMDGSDSGAYLYSAAVSATTVVVYPGSYCKPYIDFSACTLSAGHKITFVW